jgi:molecular chaperone Hsp33
VRTRGQTDALQRFVFERARVRGELVRLDEAWREVHRRRDYPEAVRTALGELTAASLLLAATVKFAEGALILQIQGGRPLGLLAVECRSDRTFRATARWDGESDAPPPTTPLGELAAGGRCAITIDPGGRRSAYQGVVPLEDGTAAESLERYMARSEQLETLFALAADEGRAAGLLLQKLPEDGGRRVEDPDPDLWNRTSHLLRTLTREELLELPEREILRRLFHDEELRLFESTPVRFACRCSRDRVARVIRMIGAEEARAVLEEEGRLHVTCEFCGEDYTFDRAATERALADTASGTPPAAG